MMKIAGCAAVALLALVSAAQAQSDTHDPRVGLRAGSYDDSGRMVTRAAEASSNMMLIAHEDKPNPFNGYGGPRGLTFAESDMAFRSHYMYQGNFAGFTIWDIANPAQPKVVKAYACNTGQGDPSIWGHLLFISSESTGNRMDCAMGGVAKDSGQERSVGVRIFDVSNPLAPRKVADVQTCRGSHTHTLMPDPTDKNVVYIYVSGTAGVRSADEMASCHTAGDSANSSLFRIDVIKVPLDHPEKAALVNGARIFDNLTRPAGHGQAPGDIAAAAERAANGGGRGGRVGVNPQLAAMMTPVIDSIAKSHGRTMADAADSTAATAVLTARFGGGRGRGPVDPNAPTGPNQCHDITVYPAIQLGAGACAGYGLLLDLSNPANPTRIQAVGDTNFSFWHSATFSNDGSKLLFTDEWGGGTAPKCRFDDPIDWGGDAIFTLQNKHLTQTSYFKMPAAQTSQENCVAHNGSLVPVPGRDIMVQGWYQGGVDVFDFTDIHHPREIAFFDRGPLDSTKLVTGGYWAGYYYNGNIYASEIARGIDVFKLTPSADLSQNEIDAAALIHMEQFNPQSQPKLVWPAAFPVALSYVDQLARENGLPAARLSAITASLKSAEKMAGPARKAALTKLAASIEKDAGMSTDATRVQWLVQEVKDIAKAAK